MPGIADFCLLLATGLGLAPSVGLALEPAAGPAPASGFDRPRLPFPNPRNTRPELSSHRSALGTVVRYDSRDNSINPRAGELINAAWMLRLRRLGSDVTHDRFTLAASFYRPIGQRTVIAARASVCGVSSGRPFYDLCQYGANGDLRGYEPGRYRDGASWATQAELRYRLVGRVGGTLFAGVGGVAPGLGQLADTNFLPAAGAGLSFRPSSRNDLKLRIDYAMGKDSSAFYISLGDAF